MCYNVRAIMGYKYYFGLSLLCAMGCIQWVHSCRFHEHVIVRSVQSFFFCKCGKTSPYVLVTLCLGNNSMEPTMVYFRLSNVKFLSWMSLSSYIEKVFPRLCVGCCGSKTQKERMRLTIFGHIVML